MHDGWKMNRHSRLDSQSHLSRHGNYDAPQRSRARRALPRNGGSATSIETTSTACAAGCSPQQDHGTQPLRWCAIRGFVNSSAALAILTTLKPPAGTVRANLQMAQREMRGSAAPASRSSMRVCSSASGKVARIASIEMNASAAKRIKAPE